MAKKNAIQFFFVTYCVTTVTKEEIRVHIICQNLLICFALVIKKIKILNLKVMEKTKNVFRSWKIMGKSFVILLATLFWIKFQWKFILWSKWGKWVIWRPKINSFEIFLKLMDEIFSKLCMIETTRIKKCFFSFQGKFLLCPKLGKLDTSCPQSMLFF